MDVSPIPGLEIVPDFITLGAELDLVTELARQSIPGSGRLYKRYGQVVYPDHRCHDWIPAYLMALSIRMPMPGPHEITVNDWPPMSKLSAHVDKGGPVVCALSILSGGHLRFSHPGKTPVTIRTPRRGLMVMTGPARNAWSHEVMPTPNARISLVFRTVT